MFKKKNKKCVLLVDNFDQAREVTKAYLEASDYKVIAVGNATNAMAQLEKKIPDLIMSEIELPGTGSIAFYNTLKKQKITRSVPFIFYARSENPRLEEGIKKFHDIYIPKNKKWKDVSALLQSFLADREQLKIQMEQQAKQAQQAQQAKQIQQAQQAKRNAVAKAQQAQQASSKVNNNSTPATKNEEVVEFKEIILHSPLPSSKKRKKRRAFLEPLTQGHNTDNFMMAESLFDKKNLSDIFINNYNDKKTHEPLTFDPLVIPNTGLREKMRLEIEAEREDDNNFILEVDDDEDIVMTVDNQRDSDSDDIDDIDDIFESLDHHIENVKVTQAVRENETETEEVEAEEKTLEAKAEEAEVTETTEEAEKKAEAETAETKEEIEKAEAEETETIEEAEEKAEAETAETKEETEKSEVKEAEAEETETTEEAKAEEAEAEETETTEEAEEKAEAKAEEATEETKEETERAEAEETKEETERAEVKEATEETKEETERAEAEETKEKAKAEDVEAEEKAEEATEETKEETERAEAKAEEAEETETTAKAEEKAEEEETKEETERAEAKEAQAEEATETTAEAEEKAEEETKKAEEEEAKEEVAEAEAEETTAEAKEEVAEAEAEETTETKEEAKEEKAEEKTAEEVEKVEVQEETEKESQTTGHVEEKISGNEENSQVVIEASNKIENVQPTIATINNIPTHSIENNEIENNPKVIYLNKNEKQWIQELDDSFTAEEFEDWEYSAFSMASLCLQMFDMHYHIKQITLDTQENQIILSKNEEKEIYCASILPNTDSK